jgi:parvulin-like peptidyl-prolyl isomerase
MVTRRGNRSNMRRGSRHAWTVCALATALAVSACNKSSPASKKKDGPKPVAVVNGEVISVADFKLELQRARAEAGDGEVPMDVIKKRVLDDLTEKTLILQQAKARSITVGQDQVERAFLRLRSEYPGTHFDDLLAKERLSAADLKTRLQTQLTIEKLFSDEVFPQVQITDDEVQRYYSEQASEFEQPERVRAVQIVVKTKEEAQKVREEVKKKPNSFAEQAKRTSIAPEGKKGGDLGYFGKDSGMPEVFDTCFKLPLNQVSEVTPSPYGFHIFKVVDRKSAAKRPFAEVKASISAKLLRERRAKAQEDYLAALKAKAQVKIDEPALAAVTLSTT